VKYYVINTLYLINWLLLSYSTWSSCFDMHFTSKKS